MVGDDRHVALLFRRSRRTLPSARLYLSGFGIALGVPNQQHAGETTFAIGAGCFEEEYQEQDLSVVTAYDKVQADYAGARATDSWSERLAAQFGQPEQEETKNY